MISAAGTLSPPPVRQTSWRFGAGMALPAEGFEAWNGIWEGLAAVHGKRSGIDLTTTQRLDLGDGAFEWRLREL